jgi:molecular chaperone GrpE
MNDNPKKKKRSEPPAEAEKAKEKRAAKKKESPEEQLEQAKEEVQRYMANWQRAEADLQNYKRRAEQERDEMRRFGLASVLINILPMLDDFERAFASLDARLAGLTWFDGMRLIYRKLQMILENSGVSPIQTDGQDFDPHLHEAVAHQEGEEGKVVAEIQRGYKLHDRVLRPAMVVVGKGTEGEQVEAEGDKAAEGEGGDESTESDTEAPQEE